MACTSTSRIRDSRGCSARRMASKRSPGATRCGAYCKMWVVVQAAPRSAWSERMYQKLLPAVDHLPAERQRLWTYFKLWPNVALDIYPDQIDFMQFISL